MSMHIIPKFLDKFNCNTLKETIASKCAAMQSDTVATFISMRTKTAQE